MKVSEYPPPPTPWDYTLFPCPLQRFCWHQVASWSYEPNFWLNWQKIYYPSPDWSSAFCNRSTNVYPLHIRYILVLSVIHPLLIRQSQLVVSSLSVTYALLMRFMRSIHVPRRHSSPKRRLLSPDEHPIHIFCIFFCPFSIRYPYPLICDSTIRLKGSISSYLLIDRIMLNRLSNVSLWVYLFSNGYNIHVIRTMPGILLSDTPISLKCMTILHH